MVEDLRTKLSESNRILPGGYILLVGFAEYAFYFKQHWAHYCQDVSKSKLMP